MGGGGRLGHCIKLAWLLRLALTPWLRDHDLRG